MKSQFFDSALIEDDMVAMKLTPDMMFIALAILWSLLLPSYPDAIFEVFDTLVGVFFLLLIVLMTLSQGVVPGVLTIVAVALTFVERNRRKINRKIVTVDSPDLKQQLAPAPPMSPLEVHPTFEYPEHDETTFYPEEQQNDSFEPVGQSINEKAPIPVISSNTDSAEQYFMKMHLAKTELD
jgi:hypothetical protein